MSLKKCFKEIEHKVPLDFTRTFEDDNVIHFSAIPWLILPYHMQEAILFLIAALISFGKMTISENGKEPCPCHSCTPWINGRLTFRTICRLFSRNHESVVIAFVTLQETLIMLSKH
jgi:hypothetical protein